MQVITFPATPQSPGGFHAQQFPVIRSNGTLTPWNIHRLHLDRLPSMKITHDEKYKWLVTHVSMMMSEREKAYREVGYENPSQNIDHLWELKDSLHTIVMRFTGLQGEGRHFIMGLKGGGDIKIWTLLFFTDLRLDLSGNTVVLDGYVVSSNGELGSLLGESPGVIPVNTSEKEIRLWKELLPAAAERCRQSWKHDPDCAYLKKGSHIPLSYNAIESPICNCGAGKDVEGLKRNKVWSSFAPYATRIAISPLFAISYLESIADFRQIRAELKILTKSDADPQIASLPSDGCQGCGQTSTKLLVCSRCKVVKYCSQACQIKDWKKHKGACR